MKFLSIPAWLREKERKRNLSILLLEWMGMFACASLFWGFVFLEWASSLRSLVAAATISLLYACGLFYLRIYPITNCRRCRSLLPLVRHELSRRCVSEEERCIELERGGEEYLEHFLELYNRTYRVEIVRFQCARCKRVWDEVERQPTSQYRFVRRITVKD